MSQPTFAPASNKPVLSRRTVFAGAAVAGAAVTAAAVLPGVARQASPTAVGEIPATTGGYRLTEHVQRYYQTAKV